MSWAIAAKAAPTIHLSMAANFSGIRAFAAVVVFEPNDVVFAEIVAALHFDDMHRLIERVRNSVYRANRNVGRFVHGQVELFVIQRDACLALHHRPVFRALRMLLQ